MEAPTPPSVSTRTTFTFIEGQLSQYGPDPISEETLYQFHLGMSGLWFFICITGISANVVNLRTFRRMGLQDTVTTSFFVLAISDLGSCSFALLDMSCFFVYLMSREFNLYFYMPPLFLAFYFHVPRRLFNTTTIIITTILALQRCVAVVFPFKVKTIFTKTRTLAIFSGVFVVSGTCHILYITEHYVYQKVDPIDNRTSLALHVPSTNEPISFITEVFYGIAVNISCQTIVICCLAFMLIALKRSANFRQGATTTTTTNAVNVGPESKLEHNCGQEDAIKRRSKESQAIIQVSLVSIIFVITNAPFLYFAVGNLTMPQLDLYGAWHNFYIFLHNVMFTSELINSSVNFIVYYKYNTRFRKYLNSSKTIAVK